MYHLKDKKKKLFRLPDRALYEHNMISLVEFIFCLTAHISKVFFFAYIM